MKLFGRLFMGLALATCIGFAGCGGDDAKKETPAPPKTDAPEEGASNSSAPSGGEMVLVSLKLPNMTWGGCVKEVREALTSVPQITIEELSPTGDDGPIGNVKVEKGFDLDAKLNELAGKYSKLKDWSRSN